MSSEFIERFIECPTGPARVMEKGEGDTLGYFAGLHGLPKWQPVLDELSKNRKIIAPSLPGYPGGGDYEQLDDVLDWALAVRDIHAAAGLDGTDLVGASVGAALAAEIAALWPGAVGRLVLIAPYGHYDVADPTVDVFAQYQNKIPHVMSAKGEDYAEYISAPNSEDELEWDLSLFRAQMAAARMLWPLGDTKIMKRLGRITLPTLIIWGSNDDIIPSSYAQRFADAICGQVSVRIIEGAGHKVEFDAPEEVAVAIGEFLDGN